jgi:two-component system, sensor histidine kinase PdtaS
MKADDAKLLGQLEHLERLVGAWGMVADFAFSDLLLFRPVDGTVGEGSVQSWVVSAQIRPTTSRTLYPDDLVGTLVRSADRPQLVDAFASGAPVEGNVFIVGQDGAARVVFVPVRLDGEVIAVLTREIAIDAARRPGRLERTYLEITDRLTAMIADGSFPFVSEDVDLGAEVPRVGDGAILLDAERSIVYASPNAVSALHRLGVYANAEGARLAVLGVDDTVVSKAFVRRQPALAEIERSGEARGQARTSSLVADLVIDRSGAAAAGAGVGVGIGSGSTTASGPTDRTAPGLSRTVLLTRCIPLLQANTVTGAILLIRDVTEVRRRDRMLLSKDATIREVHHRVKNNLQTVSALLRLQGRRLASPEAKQAIEESVRRVRSIALVHETLSREIRDSVPFDEVVRPLVRLVEEGLQTNELRVRFIVEGEMGDLAPETATPLAVVLVELLQNAVEHAYPTERGEAVVHVQLSSNESDLRVIVRDRGVGFPSGFSLSGSGSLGLTIVRTLVTSELGGVIAVRNDGGAVVELRIPRR